MFDGQLSGGDRVISEDLASIVQYMTDPGIGVEYLAYSDIEDLHGGGECRGLTGPRVGEEVERSG